MRTKSKKAEPAPKTKAEFAAWRCRCHCKMGRDVLDGVTKPPPGCSELESAVFLLLHAVEDLSLIAVEAGKGKMQ